MCHMREYGQFCALAKALDVVGDRWTLLIVRELSIRPCRYTDLRDGLPGIATNLLAERLRTLEAGGVIASEAAPPPVATTLYRLTDWGNQLLPAVGALARWAAPLMRERPDTDEFRPRWMVAAARATLGELGDASDLEPLAVVFEIDGEEVTVRLQDGQVHAELSTTTASHLRVACDADTAFALLSGAVDLPTATKAGAARITGDRQAQTRLRHLLERSRRARP